MNLKQLMMSLAGKPKPNPAQLVWLSNCPEKVGDDFAGAIAQAECELENEPDGGFAPNKVHNVGFCLGSTAYLAGCLEKFTAEEVDQDWEQICTMMNW